ncbi:hypothetical protein [Paenibacillus radicis (ex Xue et al. 2023)]|uniref:Uncharacterized protein n=1 Tax=Paenibacillus radicis (ex Xue et al. 2023) TaxID=2972489 RepID=A0ABT1YJ89_9BACL|nr:hypothetical protein [Paenibacillus radicis (ex Xue et al. 2023)]MCR8633246.1 hypothetical protein [Paenibacillus radicis (ex Xue et al. 2023)]
MQKAMDGAPDFNDAAAALNTNSDEPTDSIGSVYGKDAGEAFRNGWQTHIAFFVDYVNATAAKDEARLKAPLELLIMPLDLPNSCQTLTLT